MEQKSYFTEFLSPLGPLQLRGTESALHALYMAEHRHRPPLPKEALRDDSPLRHARKQVEEFLSGQRLCFSVPIELHGTKFQRLVWRELLAIPYGTTLSYGEIARRIGSPGASRAVGSANGRNPLSLVVPCHRVIGATGALSGYGGGLEQKRFLLLLEKKHAAPPASLPGCLGQTQHPSHQILTSQTAGSPAVCAGEAPPC